MTTPTPPPEPADELIARLNELIDPNMEIGANAQGVFILTHGENGEERVNIKELAVKTLELIPDLQALLTSQQRELAELRRPTTSGETPVTDKAAILCCHVVACPLEVARQLERELAAANAKVAELEWSLTQEEMDAQNKVMSAELSTLRTELERLKASK